MKPRRALQLAVLLCLAHSAGAAIYYVNDASTNGDVYCSAVGNSGNSGTTAASPKAMLQEVLDAYSLTGGDIVYVDTGLYPGQTTTFGVGDQGSAGNFLTIQGSTNYAAGGTVLDRQANTADVVVMGASYVRLADLQLRGGRYGLYVPKSYSQGEYDRVMSVSNVYGFYEIQNTYSRFTQCAAVKNTYGCRVDISRSQWDRGVSWSNAVAFQFDYNINAMTISNSVIVGGAVFGGSGISGFGDYNILWGTVISNGYLNLNELQRDKDSWWHSTYADPQFANPAGLDFHLRSEQGRYDPISSAWVTDTVTSAAIDFGSPSAAYANEPLPNGSRMDAGCFGNSAEASRSPTNALYLMALTYDDGGTLWYTGTLYWVSRNFPPTGRVRLDYSLDRGANWENIATNVLVTNGFYHWNAQSVTSSPAALWRVVSEAFPSVADTNDKAFIVKGTNEVIRYYVNDGSTHGDVYCTAAGSATNDGWFPWTPKASIQEILNDNDLSPADIIYVDTGLYVLTNTITVGIADQGAASNLVTIQGSTNYSAGGTVLDRRNRASDVVSLGGSYVRLADLQLRGGRYGAYVTKPYCEFDRVMSVSNVYGFYEIQYTYSRFTQCAAVKNTYGCRVDISRSQWDRGVSWSNAVAFQLDFNVDAITVSNSVIVGGAVLGGSGISGFGDYNIIWNAEIGNGYMNLRELQRDKDSWWHSTYADPQFANPAGLDFHPRSKQGRYDPVARQWITTDTSTSAVIDFADPHSDYTHETAPNGGRMNAGLYGNTTEASRTPTNTVDLLVLSFNDAGTLWYTGMLYWVSRNFPSNGTVRLDYSGDAGGSWVNVATNIPVTNGCYFWNASSVVSTPRAYWRVVSEANPGIADTNDRMFVIKGTNDVVRYYVNDGSTNGDVYCTAAGNSTNDGFFPSTPKASLEELLNDTDLGPADIVYVDTGLYALTNTIVISVADEGASNKLMTIQGSTNYAAGGTVFDRRFAGADVVSVLASYIRLADLRLRGGRYGLYVKGRNSEYEGLHSISNSCGFYEEPWTQSRFTRCAAIRNTTGYRGNNSASHWNHGLSWSNTVAFLLEFNPYPVTISNSVIVGGTVFSGSSGQPAYGDYNVIWNASIGLGYLTLSELQSIKNTWWNSTVADPLFADSSAFDFHPKSLTGTYSNGSWVAYSNHSPCIDMAAPSAPYVNESDPHGGNANVGIYGNTAEASRSVTNAWLQVLSYNDGGILNVPGGKLIWRAGNYPSGSTVRIEFSGDSGVSWLTVATNLQASDGVYTWANTNFASSRFGRWRVMYESNTNILSATRFADFSLRNGPYSYFINDNNRTGDIYTTVVGSDFNLGVTSNTPKASLQAILNDYDLEPGDIVYADTGVYGVGTIRFTALDSGADGVAVVIQGSTNILAGGTVFNRNAHNQAVMDFDPAYGTPRDITIRDVILENALRGAWVRSASGIRFERVTARQLRGAGFEVLNSSTVTLSRCVARYANQGVSVQNTRPVQIESSIFWQNSNAAIQVVSGCAFVSNSVMAASGDDAYLYVAPAVTNIVGDYNDLYVTGNAVVGYVASLGRNLDSLSAWTAVCTQETHSLCVDPLFANAEAGDYHLKTQTPQGRYSPWEGNWINDGETSLLIDSGDPAAPCTNEPAGVRINIGLFGNTPEASRGRTNVWLAAVGHQAGGWTRGASPLHWVACNSTGGSVRVEVSTDGGSEWTVLTNDVPITNEVVYWNTTSTNDTPAALWGVFSTSDSNLFDRTTNFVGIRNGGSLDFFVNDGNTSGDMYCANGGAFTNWQATSNQPMDSLTTVFRKFDIEPGDRIFVDTGVYTNGPADLEVARHDGGSSGWVVQVLGSTNEAAGGSLFDRETMEARPWGLGFNSVQWVAVSNITITGADTGVLITNSANLILSVRSFANASNGFEVLLSSNISIRHSVAAYNGLRGISGRLVSGMHIHSSVIWSNLRGGIYLNGGTMDVTNSIVTASGLDRFVYELAGSNDVLKADYNDVCATEQAWFAKRVGTVYKYLSSWQDAVTNDVHSLSHDPLFADPSAGDFHLKSVAGRYQPGLGIVTDTVSSLLIDAGAPGAPFGAEPAPNGGRLNVGLYGNTEQASRSRTNGWLVALSLNSGGLIRETNFIYWVAGGTATGMQVYVDYSSDGGTTWTNIATNCPASEGRVLWNTSLFLNSALGKWRVTSQSDTNVTDVTDVLFALKNEPLGYYVNDAGTNGDVYTTAPGNDANDGLRPSTPKATLQNMLNSYILEGGDQVLIDTGTYLLTNSVVVDSVISGTRTNLFIIQGSTNEAAGGTVLHRKPEYLSRAIEIRNTVGIGLKDLRITNAARGVYVFESTNCVMERIRVDSPQIGFELKQSVTNEIAHSVVHAFTATGVYSISSSGTKLEGGAFLTRGSSGICVSVSAGDVSVSNSVFSLDGPANLAYQISADGVVNADYNALQLTNSAMVAVQMGPLADRAGMSMTFYDSVARWMRDAAQDRHSLSGPLGLADPLTGDYHPLSQGGRYVVSNESFVIDSTTSPLVDSGDPLAVFTNEPDPNGGRLNIGPYGNTSFASKTPTNASFTIISLNDGGRAEGTGYTLLWIAHGAAATHTIRLDFSPNEGSSWQTIVSNRSAASGAYAWNTTLFTNTVRALWRIVSESDTNTTARSEKPFAVRNGPMTFYVNDSSTNGDVYTSAVGSSTNLGLLPSAPKASLQQILDAYDLEGGDTVYVDTGVYTGSVQAVISQLDAGDGLSRVVIQGSTNEAAGGTRFQGFGIRASDTRGIELKHLTLAPSTKAGTDIGVVLVNATNSVVEWVRVQGGHCGFSVNHSSMSRFSRCVASGARSNGIEVIKQSSGTEWNSGILWSNGVGVYAAGDTISVSNSIIGAFGTGKYAFYAAGNLRSDYNDIYISDGAYAGIEYARSGLLYQLPLYYDSVSAWTYGTGRDKHSFSHDPGFVDAGGGDFHLRSTEGRFVSSNASWVTDASSSRLIDAGDPLAPCGIEPDPNGSRINIGLYGGTAQASKTPTNALLTLLTLNDGGRAEGTNYFLYWVAQGAATGHSLRIRFSSDAGATWSVVATNLPASDGFYPWDTTLFTSTVRGVLSVESQNDTNVLYQSSLFAVRNTPMTFYVNDQYTDGDVYTVSPGSGTNLGLSPSQPMLSIQAVLSTYDLDEGDVVYVDTGLYAMNEDVYVGQWDSANSTSALPVTIQGSTNYSAGGTVLDRRGGAFGIRVSEAIGVRLRDMSIRNANVGVRLYRSPGVECDRLNVQGGQHGFDVERVEVGASVFRNCMARNTSGRGLYARAGSTVKWLNGILWSNAQAGVHIEGGGALIRNSVIGAFGADRYAFIVGNSTLDSDYNNIFLADGALAAYRSVFPEPIIYQTVSRWVRDSTQDVHSLSHDPGFASLADADFHPVSQGGRYVPSLNTFVTDAWSSVLIDAGDPSYAFSHETSPHGARVNVGLYGNTGEASRSPTNASFTAVTLNDGGRVEGASKLLYWVAHGDATAHVVRIEFSPDAGATWQLIATNLPAGTRTYTWNTLAYPSTMLGLWRVVSETDTNVSDVSDTLFAVRNERMAFYVNDSLTNGDIYTSAPGNSTNTGTHAWDPQDTVQAVLDAWDIEPGDIIYIDTGTYALQSPTTVGYFDRGLRTPDSAYHVTIQGSTNEGAGGTVFTYPFGGNGLELKDVSGVDIKNLTIRRALVGIHVEDARYCSCEFVRCEHGLKGFNLVNSSDVAFRHCVAWGNADVGLSSVARASPGAGILWDNGVLWSNRTGVYVDHSDYKSFILQNSIVGAFEPGDFAFFVVKGGWTSDYNNIYLRNGAMAAGLISGGFIGGRTSRYETVAHWYAGQGQDAHSTPFEPRFADANNGDFHLRSISGRYVPGVGWTNDPDSSFIIDSGSPRSGWTNEPMPNGGRMNIDLYGNTWQASKTPTNGWLNIVTLNDGGSVQGTNVELRWFAGWVATGHVLRLDYSGDAGITWTNIVSNSPPGVTSYIWDTMPYGRSAVSKWRITSVDDPSISCTNEGLFVLRNGGTIPYYVNDTSTVGDVYTVVPGSPENSGLFPHAPKDSIQGILDAYKLEPRDTIYVDTGRYELNNTITIDDLDSGSATGYVVFADGSSNVAHVIVQGSTNYAYGGSVLVAPSSIRDVLALVGASGVEIRDLTLCHGNAGLSMTRTVKCLVERVQSRENKMGFFVSLSALAEFAHCAAYLNTTNGLVNEKAGISWKNGVIWNNPNPLGLRQGSVTEIRNSAIKASGPGQRIYQLSEDAIVTNTDYNNLVRENSALIAERQKKTGGDEVYNAVVDWQRESGQDVHSLSHASLFADEAAGDFHVQSKRGRWVPGAGFTNDAFDSPLLDAGDPLHSFTNELDPNGSRVNIGQYGNTSEASLSQTNPWLVAVSFNDRPTISGTNYLRWIYGGMASDSLVRIEASVNNGVSYSTLASNVPMSSSTGFAWDVSSIPLAAHCLWRVSSETYTNVSDEVDRTFAIKNQILTLYVNDSSTTGDVYCTAVGSPLNTGTNASSPLDEPATALYKYPVGRGDTIYIDTGVYTITSEVGLVIDETSRGEELYPITLHGSTNWLAGGSVIDRANTNNGIGLLIQNTRFVDVDNLSFKGGAAGVSVINSLNCSFTNVSAYDNTNHGFAVNSVAPVSFRRCATWENRGWGIVVNGAETHMSWEQGVVWSNRYGGVLLGNGNLSISNSIIQSPSNAYLYGISLGRLNGDYNVFWKDSHAKLMRDYYRFVDYVNLKEWQENRQAESHSVMVDPMFAAPETGDFHLRSQAGRYTNGTFFEDTETSWAIDAGNPGYDYTGEPAPNGGRMNVGLDGNTVEASKSFTNVPELLAVSLNDGGSVSGPQLLYWLSRGISPTNTVRLEYLANAGAHWQTIADGVSVMDNNYIWSNTNPPSPARWRVVLESDTNVFDAVDTTFILRSGPIFYYVNDSSTNGDIYTSVPGSPTNSGLFTNEPASSIQDILDRYDLGPSDTLFIDTGAYMLTNGVFVGALDSGVATSRVSLVGSTNVTWGGSVLRMAGPSIQEGKAALQLSYVEGLGLSDLIIENADTGILLDRSEGCLGRNITIRDGGGAGIHAISGKQNAFDYVVVTRQTGNGIVLQNSQLTLCSSVVWSNKSHAVLVDRGTFSTSNSVFHASGSTNVCYYVMTNSAVIADYNDLYTENGAGIAFYNDGPVERLAEWTGMTTQDIHSLTVDPLFADPGHDDFHVRSETGRYDPGAADFVTTDTNTSWLIDTGHPAMIYTNEPAPNGGRLNIGLYGNTTQASKSRTNAWLLAITASGGGRLEGYVYLAWASGRISNTNKVRLDYSYDDGISWMTIAEKQSITNGQYIWNSAEKLSGGEKFPSSPIARWRITLESDTNVFDMTDSHFALRNKPFFYYLNDTNYSSDCDIYTTAPGDDSNLGIFSNAPKATLSSLLSTLDVEGGDVILIDAGIYPVTNSEPITVTVSDQGKPSNPVIIRGNTNCTGSVFDRTSCGTPSKALLVQASYMNMKDVEVRGGHFEAIGQKVTLTNIVVTNGHLSVSGTDCRIADSKVYGGDVTFGATNGSVERFSLWGGAMRLSGLNVLLKNSVIYNTNNSTALRVESGENMSILNNTVVSRGSAFGQVGLGSYSMLSNNILVADGALPGDDFCIQMGGGFLDSDYNNLVARNGAWIGNREGNWEKLLYWQRASGRDIHSLSHDPLFADEANRDLHLKSSVGRYLNGVWTNDGAVHHSPLIDAGVPWFSHTNEPSPNGGRLNMGAYGNTPQASKSRTNAWLLAITMNDGGVLKGTNNLLRWSSGNLGTTDLVRIEYSANGGPWTTVASNLSAASGEYVWDTTTCTSSLQALWRVVLQTNTAVQDQVDNAFAVRNTPLSFYVNDSSTNNDVYTSAVGSPGNSGLVPSAPKDSIQGVLDAYDTEGGDIIYVDTGVYPSTNHVNIIWSRGGDAAGGNLLIQGSTNAAAGGSILRRTGGGKDGVNLPASYVTLRDFTIEQAYRGVFLESNQFNRLERLFVRSNQYGIVNYATRSAINRNIRLWNNAIVGIDVVNARTTLVENCDFVVNQPAINSNSSYRVQSSQNNILQNNIFYIGGSNNWALAGDAGIIDNAFIDYNIYFFERVTNIFLTYRDLMPWQLAFSNDFRSAITNPLFADVASGDFHLRSAAGRYLDGYGWTADVQSSWGIDKGNPASDYLLEPSINGDRINIGAFGNTEYASRSSTNVVVYCRVLNSTQFIGEANNVWPLIWTVINVPTDELFSVQYSGDGGQSWVNLATNVNAYNEFIIWNTTPYYNTYKGRWRVVGESNTNYWDASDASFNIFYGVFKLYPDYTRNPLRHIYWRGAWDEVYQVQYSTNLPGGEEAWFNAPTGGLPNQTPFFRSTRGGDFVYEDVESATYPFRCYRVIWLEGSDYMPAEDIYLELMAINRARGMNNIVWRCAAAGTFTVQYSTNYTSWLTAETGAGAHQKASFTVTVDGTTNLFEDVASSNAGWRVYRVSYISSP